MSEFNTFEFVVDEKPEGTRRLKKFLGRFAVLGVVIGFIVAMLALQLYPVVVLPLALLGIVLYFWKIFNVELEYSMTSGIMTFSRIYGGIRRRKVLDVMIKDMQEIAPRSEKTPDRLELLGVEKTYMFASHSSAADQYYAVFEKDGVKCAIYFEATEKTLKILRYYNPITVVTKVSR